MSNQERVRKILEDAFGTDKNGNSLVGNDYFTITDDGEKISYKVIPNLYYHKRYNRYFVQKT